MWNILYFVRTDSERYPELIQRAERNDVKLHIHIIPVDLEEDLVTERVREIMMKEIESAPVDAVITRGSLESHLDRLKISDTIPVVPVQYLSNTTYDLMLDVRRRHPEAFASDDLKVVMFSRRNIDIDESALWELFHAKVSLYAFGKFEEEKIRAKIRELKDQGISFIIAGGEICKIADEIGVPAYFNPNVNDQESVLLTINMAIMIVKAMRIQTDYVNTLEEIIDYSFEALLQVDDNGKILFCNSSAAVLFQTNKEQLVGKAMQDVCPDLVPLLAEVQTNQESQYGKIISWKDSFIMVNISLNFRENKADSVMLHLTEKRAVENISHQLQTRENSKGLTAKTRFQDLVGDSDAFRHAAKMAMQFAPHDSSVLLMGESGTGKDLFAQSIHNASQRREQPFVAINCGAIPMNLIESELFGYVSGAFTGASKQGKMGLLEMANHGTIFLDEIGEMDISGQVRLLRALEDRAVTRVGGTERIPINVRVIAATNRDLKKQVAEGTFREDLYYRLNVLTLRIPSLRERKEDIPALADFFLRQYGQKNSKSVTLTRSARKRLMLYDWPGNVRQLRNFCERMVIVTNTPVVDEKEVNQQLSEVLEDSREISKCGSMKKNENNANIKSASEREKHPADQEGWDEAAVSAVKADQIREALRKSRGNRSKAAELLNISRSTLWRRMKEYGVEIEFH